MSAQISKNESIGTVREPCAPTPARPLRAALDAFDALLSLAVERAEAEFGPASLASLRGLQIDRDAVRNSLRKQSTADSPAASVAGIATVLKADERFGWLIENYALSDFESLVVLIALAPEIDLRYERVYAYLQDDVTKKRPTVDLALGLVFGSAEGKLRARHRFARSAPLVRNGVIHLAADPHQSLPPLLAHYLKLDDQFVRLLLGDDSFDERIASYCELSLPAQGLDSHSLPSTTKHLLRALCNRALNDRHPLRALFHGPCAVAKKAAAEAIACELGLPLITVDVARACAEVNSAEWLSLLIREAELRGALLYMECFDYLQPDDERRNRFLISVARNHRGTTLCSGSAEWAAGSRDFPHLLAIPFPAPDVSQRRARWDANLAEANIRLERAEVQTLAERFSLTLAQIDTAVSNAAARLQLSEFPSIDALRPPAAKTVSDELFRCARSQSGRELAKLARKIRPKSRWSDIVLPDETKAQLREICDRVTHRHRVLNEWGFDEKLSAGKGVTVLFSGSSGTGKTMAAEVIAAELGLDLFKVDLSQTVSKYIGDTEKNLERIFSAASNEILFFDEADALFGKRSEVKDAHDRFANIEVSYLLQRMEQYEGIAILATNLRDNLDAAFKRRLAFSINFPFPTEALRRQIWHSIWPRELPVGDDIDFDLLAAKFKLSGGNIKNVSLAAAYFAAANGGVVTAEHLASAIQREYQKLGKQLSLAELVEATSI